MGRLGLLYLSSAFAFVLANAEIVIYADIFAYNNASENKQRGRVRGMEHLGDITALSGYTAMPVDVVIGGSPCQDLSLAGRRTGLAGARSGLFLEQIRVIKEMRNATGNQPRYMVWENVIGAFSSNDGEDFRTILTETARVAEGNAVIPRPPNGKWRKSGCIMGNGWSIAWRVLNAQFWGVPQGRRRIALIADFGGYSAPEILFVRESVCGAAAACRSTRENPAAGAESDSYPAVWCLQGNAIDRSDTAGCNGKGWKEGIGYTLNTIDRHGVCILQQGIARRLTPLEWERLQGFPDNWTDIGAWTDEKGKVHEKCSDTMRYQALGNSIAIPPWQSRLGHGFYGNHQNY